jgi:hypothetical protein
MNAGESSLRAAAGLGACVVALLLAGCGGSNSTPDPIRATARWAAEKLREAGFSKPTVIVNRPRDVHKGQLAGAWVSHGDPRPVAEVIVYRSSQAAERFFRRGCWTAAQLVKHRLRGYAWMRHDCWRPARLLRGQAHRLPDLQPHLHVVQPSLWLDPALEGLGAARDCPRPPRGRTPARHVLTLAWASVRQ